MKIQDASFVNQTTYQKEPTMLATRYIGRRNLHISHEDALDKKIKLILAYNSIIADADQVQFGIHDFNDGQPHDNRRYNVKIEAVELPEEAEQVLNIPPRPSASSIGNMTNSYARAVEVQPILDMLQAIRFIKNVPPKFIKPLSK